MPDEQDQNSSRRTFLRGVATGAAGLIAVETLRAVWSSAVDAIVKSALEEWIPPTLRHYAGFKPNENATVDQYPINDPRLLLFRTLIGYESNKLIKLAGGRDHYLHRNLMHPDNELALNVTFKFLGGESEQYETDKIGDFSAAGSFICFGGPISNLRVASFLGYERIDSKRPRLGFRRAQNLDLKFGIQFELDAEKLRRQGLVAKRSIEGDHTPEWAIRVNDNILHTKAGQTDYLLITRLPNWIAPRRSHVASPDIVTIFSGCHGAGMNAVRPLIQSGAILGKR